MGDLGMAVASLASSGHALEMSGRALARQERKCQFLDERSDRPQSKRGGRYAHYRYRQPERVYRHDQERFSPIQNTDLCGTSN